MTGISIFLWDNLPFRKSISSVKELNLILFS